MAGKKFTRKEIESMGTEKNVVFIIDNVVYNVSEFLEDHPGSYEPLLKNTGKDASECFHEVGHSDTAYEWRKDFVIGEVVEEDRWEIKEKTVVNDELQDEGWQGIVLVWLPPIVLGVLAVFLYKYFLE